MGTAVTVVLAVLLSCGIARGYEYDPSDFATEVIDYVQGGLVPKDFLTRDYFDEPEAALGRPTVDTTGDGKEPPFGTGSPTEPVPVVPVYAPFRQDDGAPILEIVSIGAAGHLIVKFDHPVEDDPRNPCGVDFIIFGNTSQKIGGSITWDNSDPNNFVIQTEIGEIISEPGMVSVSQTGPPDAYGWHTFTDGPFADDFAPTLGRIYDPEHPDPSLGDWNEWWGDFTYPVLPFNPALDPNYFVGKTVAAYARKYGYCAGGTSFDIGELGLDWIQFVKVENPPDSTIEPEIDAVADVDPDIAPPDFDCDTDVDAADLNFFEACSTGPGLGPPAPGCERGDLDNDGDIDQSDFGLFQRCLSGVDIPADPKCRE